MRIRPIVALSATALAAVLLAGCASGPDAAETTAPEEPVGSDLCSVAAPTGETVESITVGGEFGESATVEFSGPLEIESAERAVVVDGSGAPISDGDFVSYALAVFDAASGDELQSGGFGEDALPAMPVTLGSGADTFFGCATEGSRIVMTVPESQGEAATVYVIDVLDVTPADEWCVVAEPGGEFPSVEFSGDGVPAITIPDVEPRTGVELEVLEQGDGDTVQPGDNVTVNYTGVKWSDGSVFDSSWERGEPATFSTDGVVIGFKRALEGQTAGSTVAVSMSPVCGYGEGEINESNLVGETLVFVVDIIDTARP